MEVLYSENSSVPEEEMEVDDIPVVTSGDLGGVVVGLEDVSPERLL